jgi:N-sulfoglucosamine sulfohydrolase
MRPLAFRDVLPTMQEMWRLLKSGGLAPAVSQYFVQPRPAEELYDLKADPDTISNLVGDARYARTLQRLRKAGVALTRKVGDGSERPEAEMVAAMWPGLKQPGTAPPVMTRRFGSIALASKTPGASIGYRFGDDAAWQLYTGPIMAKPGTPIEAKAIRYGYTESAAARFVAP